MVFVTTTVREWKPVFADPTCAEAALAQLAETVAFFGHALAAYVVMPTHLHTLVGLANLQQLSQVKQSIKSLTARRHRPLLRPEDMEVFNHNGRFVFWKQRFDDPVIWSEKQFHTKAEYIHNNPVKAGLVERAVDTPIPAHEIGWPALRDESASIRLGTGLVSRGSVIEDNGADEDVCRPRKQH